MVEPPAYDLRDDKSGEYRCPFCGERMLRVGNYTECTGCGESFKRATS